MSPTPAYIAGPFAGDTVGNTRRAVALCRWAVAQGYAPECIHTTIAAGGYGDDDNPADRERGLLACEARVAITARAGGALLVILRDDGTTSAGTTRELVAFQRAGGVECRARTWAEWVAEWGRNERDPNTDPRPGDVLQDGQYTVTVTRISAKNVWYRHSLWGDDERPVYCALSTWRRQSPLPAVWVSP